MNYEDDRHEFMFPQSGKYSTEARSDAVEAVIALRDYIEGLPETTATFRLKFVRESAGLDMTASWFQPEMLWLCGSWRIPEFYPQGDNSGEKWVNPNYIHSSRYTDVAAKCGCGAVVQQLPSSSPSAQFMESDGHDEDCLIEWRARAIADLYEARRRVFRRNALLARSSLQDYERFNLDRPRKVVYACQSLDLDLRRLKDRGVEKRLNTMVDLLREGYATSKVARVYDIDQTTVRSHIAQHTDHTITELRGNT